MSSNLDEPMSTSPAIASSPDNDLSASVTTSGIFTPTVRYSCDKADSVPVALSRSTVGGEHLLGPAGHQLFPDGGHTRKLLACPVAVPPHTTLFKHTQSSKGADAIDYSRPILV